MQQSGYSKIGEIIDSAINGQQAFDKVKQAYKKKQYSYGLIFMDCSMPIMDGYEASEKIRNFVRINDLLQPMIIAITGHTEEEYIKKAWKYQMDEVLPKPTNINIIKEILREIIIQEY